MGIAEENIRQVVASLMADAGLVVLTAFISLHRAERQITGSAWGRIAALKVCGILAGNS